MFENYFMIMTDPADKLRAKGAKRVTLEEARAKLFLEKLDDSAVVYISKGLQNLLTADDPDINASVFEAFI